MRLFLKKLLANLLIIGLVMALFYPAALPSSLQGSSSRFSNWAIDHLPSAIVLPYIPQSNAPISATSAEIGAAADNVSPAVVWIYGTRKTRAFSTKVELTTGTGFIVSNDGYIITNKHVVADTDARYNVVLEDEKTKTARVAYRDPHNDIAILKIDGNNYPAVTLGNSANLKIGQTVLAIGNSPSRTDSRLSVGKVSGLRKSILGQQGSSDALRNLIQTTMQLYSGDSGGPLFNLSGEVIGVNVASAVAYDNVSFSIPINDVKDAITVSRSLPITE